VDFPSVIGVKLPSPEKATEQECQLRTRAAQQIVSSKMQRDGTQENIDLARVAKSITLKSGQIYPQSQQGLSRRWQRS
jgi:hypothetical protein